MKVFILTVFEPGSDGHKAMRVFNRQRPNEEMIHGAEHCRVRLDAERERPHGHGGEAGILQQLAEGEFEGVYGSRSFLIHPACPV